MGTHRQSVVVGIKDKQPTALRLALRAAQERGADLHVLHSAGVPVQIAGGYLDAAVVDGLREQGQAVLDDARRFLDQEVVSVPVEYDLTMAGPIEALESAATEARALVIGADDLTWPDRVLGGAIASHIALHAASPVLVVPERSYPTPLTGGVVISLDGETEAEGPLQFAFEQAQVGDRLLHVLHAVPAGMTRADAESVRANIAEILAGWSEAYPDVRVFSNYPIDEPDEACLRATERAELVVVGRPHRHTLPFAVAKPLAAQLLRHAHCPVAVVPADYRGV